MSNRRRDAAALRSGALWKLAHDGKHDRGGQGSTHVRPSDPRQRALDAFAWMVAHEGYENTDVEWVLALAEVPEPVFAEHFESKADCMLAVLDELLKRTGGAVREQIDPAAPWPERVRMGLCALLDELARDPDAARIMLVECLGSGEAALARLRLALDECVPLLDEGLEGLPERGADHLPAHISEAIAGGIASILHNRALDRRTAELPGLLPELLYFALMPYLGHESALAAAYDG